MTSNGPRTGAARDVPPPRPVAPAPAAAEETGLGRAARAVADAVAGLVGGTGAGPTTAGRTPHPAASGLRDVVGALASAVGAALGDARRPSAPADAPVDGRATGSATPGALREVLAAAAPRLPIRTGTELRRAYPGLSDEEIADALVARAARATSGIGAGTGGLAATRWFAPASLLTLPIALGGETLLVAGVEVVLVGELHELYGRPAGGDARARAAAYVASWSEQRPFDGPSTAGLGTVLGAAGMRALRTQIPRKLKGVMPSGAPFVLGAALAGRSNRRATETLAERMRSELRPGRSDRP
ncbi:hypothetical protein [Blastococcus haudaquaticus]|uniref:EcsC protein family protein n=1 Tax=Blastococcus haudaquaticus TaxID=1938745 RepID=A0A286GVH5_9ACTN|nr:hypothetical protein [Blastococcus haudaquaticus]SOD99186.1 hypothetical protein SAMN06272739_2196 [Blastococcus haudaquaticus]